ncbi:MAG: 4Fe-4S binding protein [Planctomycetes bacterium]|nr:4Fe-4S binding protein [Planctomycetota bacterium]
MAKKKFQITINKNWCKGCSLCVQICPKKVFRLSEKPGSRGYFFSEPVKPELCTGCLECELHCPDLAIKVITKK